MLGKIKRALRRPNTDADGNVILPETKENLPTPNPQLLAFRQIDCSDADQYRNTRWKVECETETDADLEDTYGYNRAKTRAKDILAERDFSYSSLTEKERVARLEETMNKIGAEVNGVDVIREGVVTYRIAHATMSEATEACVRRFIDGMQKSETAAPAEYTEIDGDDLIVQLRFIDSADDPELYLP